MEGRDNYYPFLKVYESNLVKKELEENNSDDDLGFDDLELI
ncbi:MAG: hypothetical protein RR835_10500 [Peptostreptococcaceae bacterium]